MLKTTLRTPEELRSFVEVYAKKNHCSMNQVYIKAILILKREEERNKEEKEEK